MLERVFRNWPLKLLALGLAFAIWIAVTGENRVLQVHDVPLEVDLRDDCVLAGRVPAQVAVTLRGPASLIARLRPPSMEFRVDLRDAAPGKRTVQLDAEGLRGLPPDVEVVQVEPSRLQLVIDRRMRRTVPVVPLIVGAPPAGFAFYGARAQPDTLVVEGPAAEVGALDRLRTDPIHLDGRIAPFDAQVGAVPDGPASRVLDPSPLKVHVDVDAAPGRRTIDGVPVVFAGQTFAATAQPSTVRVVLSGPSGLLARIEPAQVRAVAELGGLAPGSEPHVVPVRVELLGIPASDLARIAVRSVSQARVTVRLSSRRTQS